jgi:hypothetical protein
LPITIHLKSCLDRIVETVRGKKAEGRGREEQKEEGRGREEQKAEGRGQKARVRSNPYFLSPIHNS